MFIIQRKAGYNPLERWDNIAEYKTKARALFALNLLETAEKQSGGNNRFRIKRSTKNND